MSDDHVRLPRVDQQQWELIGGYLLEGWEWLCSQFTPAAPAAPPASADERSLEPARKARAVLRVSEARLERVLRRSERAREALRVLAEELVKSEGRGTIRKKTPKM